jgi:hypothetical protein
MGKINTKKEKRQNGCKRGKYWRIVGGKTKKSFSEEEGRGDMISDLHRYSYVDPFKEIGPLVRETCVCCLERR